MDETRASVNTDRELWREVDGDYYAPSLHVTQSGGIGMNVGGSVIVKAIRDWHALAVEALPRPAQPSPEVREALLEDGVCEVCESGFCDHEAIINHLLERQEKALRTALTSIPERDEDRKLTDAIADYGWCYDGGVTFSVNLTSIGEAKALAHLFDKAMQRTPTEEGGR